MYRPSWISGDRVPGVLRMLHGMTGAGKCACKRAVLGRATVKNGSAYFVILDFFVLNVKNHLNICENAVQ